MSDVGLINPRLPIKKWSNDEVCRWFAEVRKVGGIPIFKTKYGGIEFKKGNEYCVLGVGWGAKGKAKSVWFCGVPESTIKMLEDEPADFLKLKNKCPTKYLKEIESAPPP